MKLSNRIEELERLINCIATGDCMLDSDHHPGECAQEQALDAVEILPVILPVLRAAVEYASAWEAVEENLPNDDISDEAFAAIVDVRTLARLALIAAVEEAGQ